ncbi:MAG: Outer membrane lipoprotein Omp16 [Verrucomicrobiae bacterium]|nr:Outer membrane lipoprotein Omp16 [Verrucomicrobiae bacterium]
MRIKLLAQTLILTIAVSTLTGCAWWNKHILRKKPATVTGSGPGGLTGSDVTLGERPLLTSDTAGRGEYTPIFFDYDSSRIKPTEYGKLETVASALKGNSKKLVVEGHTDERGTAEYNRALGEKRAQSARQSLVSLGIDGSRITTISFGKDRPLDPSHGDTAWSRNRRCEFIVVSQ